MYTTIWRHACFGVLRRISATWYTSTYVAVLYFIHVNLLSPSARGTAQHN